MPRRPSGLLTLITPNAIMMTVVKKDATTNVTTTMTIAITTMTNATTALMITSTSVMIA
jgi:hypothetical protein